MRLKFYFFILGFTLLISCKVQHVSRVEPATISIKDSTDIGMDASVEALIEPYKVQMDAEMTEVIGEVRMPLNKQRPESLLGNWFADLIHEETEKHLGKSIDFAVMNYGGMRIPAIPEGPLTRRTIYELMPFDNLMVVVYLNASELNTFIQHMANGGGWPVSASLRYDIRNEKAENIRLNGKPIDPEGTYSVSISDYLANGGGDCDFFKEVSRDDLGILIRQAAIDHVIADTKAGKVQEAKLEGRVRVVDDP